MLRVTTLYASTAAATAGYYTQYLTQAVGEEPGQWAGRQAERFGLTGTVDAEHLERLLTGCDPNNGATLGHALVDRTLADGRVVRAVSGFDATVSAPKSLSAWWALTGDQRLLDAHDTAVKAVIDTLQRYGATTRIRSNGGRLHPDTEGLTIAAFRQSTSRLDDPQIHTHLVVSAKVQVDDGRWFALDARLLKKHQRTLGGIYQSVLRAELTERLGVRFGEIVNGQAEIAGIPTELLDVFSKRAAQVDTALTAKEAEFRQREQRDPTRFEHAAMQREAAADTRQHKTGIAVPDLRTRWAREANDLGISAASLHDSITEAARTVEPRQQATAEMIEQQLAERASTWHRMDVLRVLTDHLRPRPGLDGTRWAAALERAADTIIGRNIDLDPTTSDTSRRRSSDGRSIWIEPIAAHYTSDAVLTQEERIATWAIDAQAAEPRPSNTVNADRLDDLQADAAAAVAGHDRLVIVIGPAGTGKTTMLRAAVNDLTDNGRHVYAVAPSAKAARVLAEGIGTERDTVAKLIHEWNQPDRPPGQAWNLARGTRLIVDEAGMLATRDLETLTRLATRNQWTLALVGDPHQLHSVARGGMFDELCVTSRTYHLEHVHRFHQPWEAAATLALRRGDPDIIDTYIDHDRIHPGTLDQHIATIADRWIDVNASWRSIAITTTANEHVDLINAAVQRRRLDRGDISDHHTASGMNGQAIHVGDVIATRRNNRNLRSSDGDIVRNRETWTVTHIADTGDITARRHSERADTVTLPAGYVAEHVQLGYATTEPGNQGDTRDLSINLITPTTTARGLYVAMTRGRDENIALVVTTEPTIEAAADVLGRVLASDRADTPAIVQRRELAAQIPPIARVPQLRPRCDIPDWWNTVRTAAVIDMHHLQQQLDTLEAERATRTRTQLDAYTDARDAADRHSTYRPTYEAATHRVERAETELASATADVGEHRFRGRRAAHDRVDNATAELAAAKAALTPIETTWRPLWEEANRTARRCNEIGESNATLDYLAERKRLPDKIASIQNRIDALDTWRNWARGHDIDHHTITHAVDTLDHANEPHHTALADTIRRTTPEQIVTPPAPTLDRYRGIEPDFGIDL